MKRISTILAVVMLAGCATHPDRIKAVAGKAECTDADRVRLAELTREQARAANTDAVGVFMIGLPIGSMSGPDHEAEIARLKGACEARPA